MTKSTKPSAKLLNEAEATLEYELRMLRDIVALGPLAAKRSSDAVTTGRALLEAFLVHARNLIAFFYKDGSRYPDEAFAVHFFDDPSRWQQARGPKPQLLEDTERRAHKLLAHISYDRAPLLIEDPTWPREAIEQELRALAVKFEQCRTESE